MNTLKYLNIIIPIALLSGCGSVGNGFKQLLDKANGLSPAQIQAMGHATSNTGIALSYFVLGGCCLSLIGIIMLAFGTSKHAGTILIAGGAGCAMTGYLIEEYAHYVLIATLTSGLAYGSFILGNKWGYKLGFNDGKGDL